MKSILLKIDDELYEELEKSAKEIHVTRTSFIKNAVKSSLKAWKKRKLQIELAKEVALIKEDKEGLEEARRWQDSSLKDLSNYLDTLEDD